MPLWLRGLVTGAYALFAFASARHLAGMTGVAGAGAGVLVVSLFLVSGLILANLWSADLGALLARPITSLFDGGGERVKADQPFYARAQALRKRGELEGAEAEVRRQLTRFPGDFAGHLLLAEMQADDHRDLPAAFATLHLVVVDAERPAEQRAQALLQEATWRADRTGETELARELFERLLREFAPTEAAIPARQRLARLPWPDGAEPERRRLRVVVHTEQLGLSDTLGAPPEEPPVLPPEAPGKAARPPLKLPAADPRMGLKVDRPRIAAHANLPDLEPLPLPLPETPADGGRAA
jgi:tetratricopeptide (TPR) repeat protein